MNAANRQKLKPDLDQTRIFLDALDPRGRFTFQTFGEGSAKDKRLAQIRNGSLDDYVAELENLQRGGAGVFVTINETDGKGRKEENITRVRALFVDLDGAPIEPVTEFELKPHIIIQSSPGRWHAYWLVDDISLDEFRNFQQALIAKFDADTAVHDLTTDFDSWLEGEAPQNHDEAVELRDAVRHETNIGHYEVEREGDLLVVEGSGFEKLIIASDEAKALFLQIVHQRYIKRQR